MRKSVVVRFFGFFGLYFLVFAAVASLQFTKKDSFSLRISNLTAEGRYRAPEEGESLPYAGSSPIAGDARVLYGGLEFILAGDSSDWEHAPRLVDPAGGRSGLSAEYLAVEEGGLRFYLNGGVQIFFSAPEEGAELRITGDFDDAEFTDLELPYRSLGGFRIGDEGNGQFVIGADGREYRFRGGRAEDRVLILAKGGLPVSYGMVDKDREWRAEDFILPEGEAGAYRETLSQWAGRNYNLWGRLILSRNDEDMVVAYEGEALQRGSYKAALSAVPRTFLSFPGRGYESSVYLGGIADAQRKLQTAVGGTLARITELLDRESPDFLLESRAIEFLAVRNHQNLIDRAVALIQNMDSESLTLEQIPGLLEARVDLGVYRPQTFGGAAPAFDALTAQAEFILSQRLIRLPPMEHYPIGLVLAAGAGRADLEWNLRLGKALADWGELVGRETWAAIGRSAVVSVLSLDRDGQVISTLNLDEGSPAGEAPSYINTARIYRLLALGDYRPKALVLNPAFPGLWAWTASPEIRATREGLILNIAVNFPVGESHYVFLQGIEPFYRLQFYGMDWRTDPNFERYDSSGWVYYPRDRVLALKVKHRADVEYIRLFTGAAPAAPVPPPVREEAPAEARTDPAVSAP
jgi:hypothetical protein